jgi:superfamily II DNA or RNA helicase
MNMKFGFAVGEEPKPPEGGKGFCPRPYQGEAVSQALRELATEEACGLYLATGTGKTEVAAVLMKEWDDGSILFIAPRRELVRQTAARLRKHGVDVGVEMAEQISDEPVTVACYASLKSRDRYKKYLKMVKLVIVDEAHVNYSTSSLDMLQEFRSFGARVVAMTASPPTKKGEDFILADHYGKPAFVYSYNDAVDDGYLVPCKMHLCVLKDLDLSKFKKSFGDFDQSRLDKLMKHRAVVAGVGKMVEQYWDNKKSVVFATSIAHAEAIRDDLQGRDIHASIVHSNMAPEEQDMHLKDFVNHRSDIIINVGILTMGWDCPQVEKLFIARATQSPELYCQIFGRGTRVLPDVIDGLATKEERKEAIAKSDKPCFEVYDITDSSRHNSIQTALDVLRSDLKPAIRRKLQDRTEAEVVSSEQLDAIILEEKQAQAARMAAANKMELAKRWHIDVGGDVAAYSRGVNDAVEKKNKRGVVDFWWMPYGKYKGQGFAAIFKKNPRYLAYMLEKGFLKNSRGNLQRNVVIFLRKRFTESPPYVQKSIQAAFMAANIH